MAVALAIVIAHAHSGPKSRTRAQLQLLLMLRHQFVDIGELAENVLAGITPKLQRSFGVVGLRLNETQQFLSPHAWHNRRFDDDDFSTIEVMDWSLHCQWSDLDLGAGFERPDIEAHVSARGLLFVN